MADLTRRRHDKTEEKAELALPPPLAAARPHPPGWFERFSRSVAFLAGRPVSFFAALGIVALWLASGPLFHFSDTWQLVINTGTTIVTFLMVFLIQQSQNRDTMALQVKLAELIIAVRGAHNALATAEDLSEDELLALHADFCLKADETLQHIEARRGAGRPDRHRPRGSAR